MARTKFQKEKAKQQDKNDKRAREVLAELAGLDDERKGRIWTMGVDTSEFYRDMCRKALFVKMYVTDRQLKWLREIAKEVVE